MGAIELLTEPLSFGTTWRAIVEMTTLGIAGGVIGCWVVLYRLSYSAESLAHGMLPGLVLAGLVGLPLLLGGVAGILVAGLLVAAATRIRGSDPDTAVAVVVTTLFGVGILMALSPASPPAVGEFLFGNLLGTTDREILISVVATVLTVALVWTLHPRLLAIGFDGDAGGFVRMSAALVTFILLALVSVTILVSVQALGTLLVAALLVGPAASARLLTRRVTPMILTSASIAILAGLAGVYSSFYLRTSAGASVVVFILMFFLVAAALRSVRSRIPAIERV